MVVEYKIGNITIVRYNDSKKRGDMSMSDQTSLLIIHFDICM